MCDAPGFLPPALNLDGEYETVLSLLYSVFQRDFKESHTYHRGVRVLYNRNILDGLNKEEGFWHVISRLDNRSGKRQIDYPRAKRLPWAKPLMESSKSAKIKVWQYQEGSKDKGIRTYIWLEDYDYALILHKKKLVFFWVTAFHIDSNWKRRDLQRKYEIGLKSSDRP